MRILAVLFSVLMVGAASAEAKVSTCRLPMYIQAPQGAVAKFNSHHDEKERFATADGMEKPNDEE